MVDPDDGARAESRAPTLTDLVALSAQPALLWKTKQTFRDRDRLDQMFLARLLPPGEAR